jgi:hypothetical protein
MSDESPTQSDQRPAEASQERWRTWMSKRVRGFANRRSVWPMAAIVAAGFLLLLLLMWRWPRVFGNDDDVVARSRPPIEAAATPGIRIDVAGGARGADAPISQAPAATAAPATAPRPSGPGPSFADFYQQRGGLAVFGYPISDELLVNGRSVQWFERARLEAWPEFAGTPYAVQIGRLGVEFTQGRSFPQQSYFPSRPDLRFFPETGHAVGEPFLSFWSQNGGLDVFGLPISEAIPENLPDGQLHTVQYFERARLEQHGDQVMIGLLGSALFRREGDTSPIATPAIVTVPPPTPVPFQ